MATRRPGLVAKLIQVRGKNGVHKRTYWVRPPIAQLVRLHSAKNAGNMQEAGDGGTSNSLTPKQYTGRRLDWQKLARLRQKPETLAKEISTLSAQMEERVGKGREWAKSKMPEPGGDDQAELDATGRILDSSIRKIAVPGTSTSDLAFWSGVGAEAEVRYHAARKRIDDKTNAMLAAKQKEYEAKKAQEDEEREERNYQAFLRWKAAKKAAIAQGLPVPPMPED